MYDEKRWAAQSELKRVLAESNAVQEKEGMLRLLLQVLPGKTTDVVSYVIRLGGQRDVLLNARASP